MATRLLIRKRARCDSAGMDQTVRLFPALRIAGARYALNHAPIKKAAHAAFLLVQTELFDLGLGTQVFLELGQFLLLQLLCNLGFDFVKRGQLGFTHVV